MRLITSKKRMNVQDTVRVLLGIPALCWLLSRLIAVVWNGVYHVAIWLDEAGARGNWECALFLLSLFLVLLLFETDTKGEDYVF